LFQMRQIFNFLLKPNLIAVFQMIKKRLGDDNKCKRNSNQHKTIFGNPEALCDMVTPSKPKYSRETADFVARQ